MSYSVYRWLQVRDFDIVHFHALGGTGYYTLSAKKQGLYPLDTSLVVGVHAITGSEMNAIDRGLPRDTIIAEKDDLVQDYMQRRSAELAVCAVLPYHPPIRRHSVAKL